VIKQAPFAALSLLVVAVSGPARGGSPDWSSAASFDAAPAREASRWHDAPEVPEPMVFDLVRPLGAKKGELEVNTLGVVPLTRGRTGSPRASDELGLVPLSEDKGKIEWAPEIEFALWDGFALELEFPFEGSTLEELKGAVQWTAGTAFGGRFIHGFQGIVEHALQSDSTNWTGLYLAAMRFSSRWSALGMWGASHETGADARDLGGGRTQILQNLSLFCDISHNWTAGLETNYAVSMQGNSTVLLMPQMQVEMGRFFTLQFGAGVGISASETLPQAAFRAILTF
jgi:hypothetical protein